MLIVSENRCMLFGNSIKLRLNLIWKIGEGYLEQVKIKLRLKETELRRKGGEKERGSIERVFIRSRVEYVQRHCDKENILH